MIAASLINENRFRFDLNSLGWDYCGHGKNPLGTIETGKATANYTAASLRAAADQSLGKFRWIVWAVSPVIETGGGENTAFQELNVEVIDDANLAAPLAADTEKATSPDVSESKPVKK